MPTVIVPRPDVTAEEISEVLRHALGPRYDVLPGKEMNRNPVGGPRADQPDTIGVGIRSTPLFRAEVVISRYDGQTSLHVIAGGIGPLLRLTNRLWIAERVRRVLEAAPGLR
jgi:hypothetical protein